MKKVKPVATSKHACVLTFQCLVIHIDCDINDGSTWTAQADASMDTCLQIFQPNSSTICKLTQCQRNINPKLLSVQGVRPQIAPSVVPFVAFEHAVAKLELPKDEE